MKHVAVRFAETYFPIKNIPYGGARLRATNVFSDGP